MLRSFEHEKKRKFGMLRAAQKIRLNTESNRCIRVLDVNLRKSLYQTLISNKKFVSTKYRKLEAKQLYQILESIPILN